MNIVTMRERGGGGGVGKQLEIRGITNRVVTAQLSGGVNLWLNSLGLINCLLRGKFH